EKLNPSRLLGQGAINSRLFRVRRAKAAEGSRTPRPVGDRCDSRNAQSVVECGCPLPLLYRCGCPTLLIALRRARRAWLVCASRLRPFALQRAERDTP